MGMLGSNYRRGTLDVEKVADMKLDDRDQAWVTAGQVLSTSTDAPLCRDCVWAKPKLRWQILGWGKSRWEYAKCIHPLLGGRNLVVGGGGYYCSTNRQLKCGREGKYFEAK